MPRFFSSKCGFNAWLWLKLQKKKPKKNTASNFDDTINIK